MYAKPALKPVPTTTPVPLACTPQSEETALLEEQNEQTKLKKCPYCAEEI